MDRRAEPRHQQFDEAERQHLNAVQKGVVDDYHQAKVARGARPRRRETPQNIGSLVKISETEMPVGLEISALGPLVPGIDEDKSFRGLELPQRTFASVRQPGSIFCGGGKREGAALSRLASFIVPAGANARKKIVLGRRGVYRALYQVIIFIDASFIVLIERLDGGVYSRRICSELVRRKLDRRVKSERSRVFIAKCLRHHQIRVSQPCACEMVPPSARRRQRVRQQMGAIHDEERAAADTYVPRILEHRLQRSCKRYVVFRRMRLRYKYFVFVAVPSPRPILVRPTGTKLKVDISIFEQQIKGRFKQFFPTKPVIVYAESVEFRISWRATPAVEGRPAISDRKNQALQAGAADSAQRSAGWPWLHSSIP